MIKDIDSIDDYAGRGQHLEWPNVERPIFRSFEISNEKITEVELFDFYIFKFIFSFYVCLNCSNAQNAYTQMIICQIRNFWHFDSFTNCQIFEISQFQKFDYFLLILKIYP